MSKNVDAVALVHILCQAKVNFVIVGGMAMIMQGSSYVTNDLDIVYERTLDNIRRLVRALARFRPQMRTSGGDIKFLFDERTIANGLNFTLSTTLGDIDLLGEVAGLGQFKNVERFTQHFAFDGEEVKVLSIKGLIRAKKASGRLKDLQAVPELEALQELQSETELPHREQGDSS